MTLPHCAQSKTNCLYFYNEAFIRVYRGLSISLCICYICTFSGILNGQIQRCGNEDEQMLEHVAKNCKLVGLLVCIRSIRSGMLLKRTGFAKTNEDAFKKISVSIFEIAMPMGYHTLLHFKQDSNSMDRDKFLHNIMLLLADGMYDIFVMMPEICLGFSISV